MTPAAFYGTVLMSKGMVLRDVQQQPEMAEKETSYEGKQAEQREDAIQPGQAEGCVVDLPEG